LAITRLYCHRTPHGGNGSQGPTMALSSFTNNRPNDRANENLRYARNRIRQELLPYLQTNLNPQIEKHLAQTAEILEAESDYLDSIARDIFRQVIDLDQQRLDRSPLQILPLAIQRRVIRLFFG